MFKEPVEIQADVNYTACATLKVPASDSRFHELFQFQRIT